jgi:hypothetical protein
MPIASASPFAGTGPDDVAERIGRALAAYGARGFQGERIPMLRWFTAAAHERLPSIDVDAECAALAKRNEIELRFVSPLRLEIPRAERGDPSSFFDAAHFPAGDFLRLLWSRIFFLAEERYPIATMIVNLQNMSIDPEEVILTGSMAIWAYLAVFHFLHGRTRRIYYEDGRGDRFLVAAHG